MLLLDILRLQKLHNFYKTNTWKVPQNASEHRPEACSSVRKERTMHQPSQCKLQKVQTRSYRLFCINIITIDLRYNFKFRVQASGDESLYTFFIKQNLNILGT